MLQTPDGSKVVGEDSDHWLTAWDVTTGKPLWRAKITSHLAAMAFDPTGTRIATGIRNYIQIWNADTGQPLSRELGSDRIQVVGGRMIVPLVHNMAYSANGHRVLVVGNTGLATVWDVATGKPLASAHGYDVYTQGAFGPDGKTFLVSGVSLGLKRFGTSLWSLPQE